mmetsp:Transcript_34178/g.97105  ORF Transcript_34178/g.97105 Transcript_34178/m.97105 type:complete len:217 (-) Transcript_34178:385-1035(-)
MDHEAGWSLPGRRHLPDQQAGADSAVAAVHELEASQGWQGSGGRRQQQRRSGVVRRPEVCRRASSDWWKEVRHAPLCAGHELPAVDGLHAPGRLLSIFHVAVLHGQERHDQPRAAPHECGGPEAQRQVRVQADRRQVGCALPEELCHERCRAGDGESHDERHRVDRHSFPVVSAEGDDQRQALLRDVWLRHPSRHSFQALASRGQCIAFFDGEHGG